MITDEQFNTIIEKLNQVESKIDVISEAAFDVGSGALQSFSQSRELLKQVALPMWNEHALEIGRSFAKATGRTMTKAELQPYKDAFFNGEFNISKFYLDLIEHPEYKLSLSTNPPSFLPEHEANIEKLRASKTAKRTPKIYMMGPRLRFLTNDKQITSALNKVENNGFNGIHIYLETDLFDFEALDYREVKTREINVECLRRLERLRAACEFRGLELYASIHGDSDHDLNPLKVWGPKSLAEQMIYSKLNEWFAHKKFIRFGLGWDLEEWLTPEYAQWIASQLQVKFSMRHPQGAYNDLCPVKSWMHRRPTTEEIQAFARLYPNAEKITEDRFRNRPYEPENTGHIPIEMQMRIIQDCVENGVDCICGNFPKKQYRYQYGSSVYPDYFIKFLKELLKLHQIQQP